MLKVFVWANKAQQLLPLQNTVCAFAAPQPKQTWHCSYLTELTHRLVHQDRLHVYDMHHTKNVMHTSETAVKWLNRVSTHTCPTEDP